MINGDDDWSSISDHIRKQQEQERLYEKHLRQQEFIENGTDEDLAGFAIVLCILAGPILCLALGLWWILS